MSNLFHLMLWSQGACTFLQMTQVYSLRQSNSPVCKSHIPIHSAVNGHTGCFQDWAVMSCAATTWACMDGCNMMPPILLGRHLEVIKLSHTESLSCLRNLPAGLHGSHTCSHSNHSVEGLPFPCSLSSTCYVISWWQSFFPGLDGILGLLSLHFSNGQRAQYSFIYFSGHLYFGEVSVHLTCPLQSPWFSCQHLPKTTSSPATDPEEIPWMAAQTLSLASWFHSWVSSSEKFPTLIQFLPARTAVLIRT